MINYTSKEVDCNGNRLLSFTMIKCKYILYFACFKEMIV